MEHPEMYLELIEAFLLLVTVLKQFRTMVARPAN
jgi:hypothetical protein